MRKRGTLSALLKNTLRLPTVAGETFTDIRTAPSIPLGQIITTVCLMPLLEVKSLLRLDFYARFKQVKRLFGAVAEDSRPICSDSTLQRVLRWLDESETGRLLTAFVPEMRRRAADRYQLVPNGPTRLIAVGDGSVMGKHHVCAFALVSNVMSVPFMIEGTPGHGHELKTASAMIARIPDVLGRANTPDLLLYDYLGFNASVFHAARSAGMHLLVKGGESEFRELLNDARALFREPREATFQTSGWQFDLHRLWRWHIEETSDTFAGYPVRVVRLLEQPVKNPEAPPQSSWIVTTDFSLTHQELREAAHVRWSIENNVFKRLSSLVATKRFHFNEQRPFVALLRIVCAALSAFDLAIYIMNGHKRGCKQLLGPVKWTYAIVYQTLFYSLEDNTFA